jgi:hypothetical protein
MIKLTETQTKDMKIGDKYTIPGFAINRHGKLIIDDKDPKTGFVYKPVKQALFFCRLNSDGEKTLKLEPYTYNNKEVKVLPD